MPRAAAAEVVHACAGFALLELVISVALVGRVRALMYIAAVVGAVGVDRGLARLDWRCPGLRLQRSCMRAQDLHC